MQAVSNIVGNTVSVAHGLIDSAITPPKGFVEMGAAASDDTISDYTAVEGKSFAEQVKTSGWQGFTDFFGGFTRVARNRKEFVGEAGNTLREKFTGANFKFYSVGYYRERVKFETDPNKMAKFNKLIKAHENEGDDAMRKLACGFSGVAYNAGGKFRERLNSRLIVESVYNGVKAATLFDSMASMLHAGFAVGSQFASHLVSGLSFPIYQITTNYFDKIRGLGLSGLEAIGVTVPTMLMSAPLSMLSFVGIDFGKLAATKFLVEHNSPVLIRAMGTSLARMFSSITGSVLTSSISGVLTNVGLRMYKSMFGKNWDEAKYRRLKIATDSTSRIWASWFSFGFNYTGIGEKVKDIADGMAGFYTNFRSDMAAGRSDVFRNDIFSRGGIPLDKDQVDDANLQYAKLIQEQNTLKGYSEVGRFVVEGESTQNINPNTSITSPTSYFAGVQEPLSRPRGESSNPGLINSAQGRFAVGEQNSELTAQNSQPTSPSSQRLYTNLENPANQIDPNLLEVGNKVLNTQVTGAGFGNNQENQPPTDTPTNTPQPTLTDVNGTQSPENVPVVFSVEIDEDNFIPSNNQGSTVVKEAPLQITNYSSVPFRSNDAMAGMAADTINVDLNSISNAYPNASNISVLYDVSLNGRNMITGLRIEQTSGVEIMLSINSVTRGDSTETYFSDANNTVILRVDEKGEFISPPNNQQFIVFEPRMGISTIPSNSTINPLAGVEGTGFLYLTRIDAVDMSNDDLGNVVVAGEYTLIKNDLVSQILTIGLLPSGTHLTGINIPVKSYDNWILVGNLKTGIYELTIDLDEKLNGAFNSTAVLDIISLPEGASLASISLTSNNSEITGLSGQLETGEYVINDRTYNIVNNSNNNLREDSLLFENISDLSEAINNLPTGSEIRLTATNRNSWIFDAVGEDNTQLYIWENSSWIKDTTATATTGATAVAEVTPVVTTEDNTETAESNNKGWAGVIPPGVVEVGVLAAGGFVGYSAYKSLNSNRVKKKDANSTTRYGLESTQNVKQKSDIAVTPNNTHARVFPPTPLDVVQPLNLKTDDPFTPEAKQSILEKVVEKQIEWPHNNTPIDCEVINNKFTYNGEQRELTQIEGTKEYTLNIDGVESKVKIAQRNFYEDYREVTKTLITSYENDHVILWREDEVRLRTYGTYFVIDKQSRKQSGYSTHSSYSNLDASFNNLEGLVETQEVVPKLFRSGLPLDQENATLYTDPLGRKILVHETKDGENRVELRRYVQFEIQNEFGTTNTIYISEEAYNYDRVYFSESVLCEGPYIDKLKELGLSINHRANGVENGCLILGEKLLKISSKDRVSSFYKDYPEAKGLSRGMSVYFVNSDIYLYNIKNKPLLTRLSTEENLISDNGSVNIYQVPGTLSCIMLNREDNNITWLYETQQEVDLNGTISKIYSKSISPWFEDLYLLNENQLIVYEYISNSRIYLPRDRNRDSLYFTDAIQSLYSKEGETQTHTHTHTYAPTSVVRRNKLEEGTGHPRGEFEIVEIIGYFEQGIVYSHYSRYYYLDVSTTENRGNVEKLLVRPSIIGNKELNIEILYKNSLVGNDFRYIFNKSDNSLIELDSREEINHVTLNGQTYRVTTLSKGLQFSKEYLGFFDHQEIMFEGEKVTIRISQGQIITELDGKTYTLNAGSNLFEPIGDEKGMIYNKDGKKQGFKIDSNKVLPLENRVVVGSVTYWTREGLDFVTTEVFDEFGNLLTDKILSKKDGSASYTLISNGIQINLGGTIVELEVFSENSTIIVQTKDKRYRLDLANGILIPKSEKGLVYDLEGTEHSLNLGAGKIISQENRVLVGGNTYWVDSKTNLINGGIYNSNGDEVRDIVLVRQKIPEDQTSNYLIIDLGKPIEFEGLGTKADIVYQDGDLSITINDQRYTLNLDNNLLEPTAGGKGMIYSLDGKEFGFKLDDNITITIKNKLQVGDHSYWINSDSNVVIDDIYDTNGNKVAQKVIVVNPEKKVYNLSEFSIQDSALPGTVFVKDLNDENKIIILDTQTGLEVGQVYEKILARKSKISRFEGGGEFLTIIKYISTEGSPQFYRKETNGNIVQLDLSEYAGLAGKLN